MTKVVAIIGGGISGTLTVLQCLKQCSKPLSVLWFDAHNQFCRGLAYSTKDDQHLLNVRAGNMSAFPDEPEHFVSWLHKQNLSYSAKDFVPRKVYGTYVEETFQQFQLSNPSVSFQKIAQEVTSVGKSGDGFVITAGQIYEVQKLVLALGNFLPAHPRSVSSEFISDENYFQNPFSDTMIEKALTKADVTILGSGLTMIDLVVSLAKHSYPGKITVISPHGYIPQAHTKDPMKSVEPFIDPAKKYSLADLVALVNNQLKKAKKEHINPYSVIDAMRPNLQTVWLNFSLAEKQQFLRHLRHKWGVARHRAPSQSMVIFNRLRFSGQLNLMKGRIFDIKAGTQNFEIQYTDPQHKPCSFNTSFLINCTGPEADYSRLTSSLVQQLLKDNIVTTDLLKYGLNAQKDGQIAQNLFTIGPPLKGILWESVAVPEIRVQAKEISAKIICD